MAQPARGGKKMRIIVLGSGLQGSACAFDLLETSSASVTLADQSPEGLAPFLQPYIGKRLAVLKLDVRDKASMGDVMRGHDAVLGAIPYYLGYDMAAMAVELGMHYADLGGNVEVVRRQETLHDAARSRGVSVIPDCGLAPGLVNVLAAEAVRRLDRCDALRLFVGGLPQHPTPPLNYSIVYSLEGVLDYYTTPSWVLRDGQPAQMEALSEVERVKFPRPLGALEAFHTGGGLSTMPWSFIGKIPTMEYKTLRYPGHADIMRVMRDVGLLGTEPVEVDGTSIVPRRAFMAVVGPRLTRSPVEDLVALKVEARGRRKGRRAAVVFQVLDYFDARHGLTAMMRTTGYSLSITGQMQLDGRIQAPGVHAAWAVTPFAGYVAELGKRGIVVKGL
jgi:lysine 6-dehydrogenase